MEAEKSTMPIVDLEDVAENVASDEKLRRQVEEIHKQEYGGLKEIRPDNGEKITTDQMKTTNENLPATKEKLDEMQKQQAEEEERRLQERKRAVQEKMKQKAGEIFPKEKPAKGGIDPSMPVL